MEGEEVEGMEQGEEEEEEEEGSSTKERALATKQIAMMQLPLPVAPKH